jgi:hypothetical protein
MTEVAAFFGALVGGVIVIVCQIFISGRELSVRKNLAKQERLDRYMSAALERRLETHQQAFALWYDLMWNLNSENNDRKAIADDCEKWWKNNNFYLDKESSSAFKTAYIVANTFDQYNPTSEEDAKNRKKDFHTIHKVGNLLREGIGLPHLDDLEKWKGKVLGENNKN